jgi:hypothetical protein
LDIAGILKNNLWGKILFRETHLNFLRKTNTAVFFCMRYKVTGFEAGGRRQEGEE